MTNFVPVSVEEIERLRKARERVGSFYVPPRTLDGLLGMAEEYHRMTANPLKPLRLAVAALRDEVNKQQPDKGAIWTRIQEVLKEADKLDGSTHDEAATEASTMEPRASP